MLWQADDEDHADDEDSAELKDPPADTLAGAALALSLLPRR